MWSHVVVWVAVPSFPRKDIDELCLVREEWVCRGAGSSQHLLLLRDGSMHW